MSFYSTKMLKIVFNSAVFLFYYNKSRKEKKDNGLSYICEVGSESDVLSPRDPDRDNFISYSM